MKKLILVLCLALPQVGNAIPSDLVSYVVTVDGTNAGRGFRGTRTDASVGCYEPFGSSCEYPDIAVGFYPNGTPCCKPKWNVQETDFLSAADSVASVFRPLQTEYHWGYIGTTSRSSNTGRTVSAKARLDACLFYTDVDAIDSLGGTDADKYSNCAGSTYGCGSTMKNEYCQANSAAVCVDRCACAYPNNGVDTCNSL